MVARADAIATPDLLSEETADRDPFQQFAVWFQDAQAAGEILPEAMTLATSTRACEPSARMVLLRGFDRRGLGFFTNYESQKGRQLAENPRGALVLYWAKLGRQVRINGGVVRQSTAESDAYFHNRPVASQISAAISPQSQVVESRLTLEQAAGELAERYRDQPVPLPATWGGYRLVPDTFEFWVHRENRLHDRLRYVRQANGNWKIERLAP